MLLSLSVWLLKSVLILGIFHYGLPPIVDTVTRNSWLKLPVMLFLGLCAGVFMAWLGYVPYLLVLVWLGLNRRTLAVMFGPKFQAEAQMTIGRTIRRPVFAVSSYAYIVIACASAWFLQAELVGADPSGTGIPLWRYLLGVSR